MIIDKLHRIPVRPLPYEDKDIAMTRELVIDYGDSGKGGNIYITDKDDPSILIDITKLIADKYLSNINGDNTNVTINGEVYNLAELLAELKRNKIEILNIEEATGVGAVSHYDHVSITISKNLIGLYGFEDAPEFAIPMKKDGRLTWNGPKDQGDPSEPAPGDPQNIILILPTEDHIILYNKPQMRTYISELLYPKYIVEFPLSMPHYSNVKWKMDAMKFDIPLEWPTNLVWLQPKVDIVPAHVSYIFSFETWDNGISWLTQYYYYNSSTTDPTREGILTDRDGNVLIDEDHDYLITSLLERV